MKFVLTLAFVCLAQNVFGAPNQASTGETSSMDDLVKNFIAVIDDTNKKLLGEDIAKHLKGTIDDAIGGINSMMTTVSEKAKELEPETKKMMETFNAKMNEHVAQFKKDNPEASASAEKIKGNLEEMMKQLVNESKEMEKKLKENSSGVVEDFKKLSQQTLDAIVAHAKEVQSKYLEKKSP